MAKTYYIFRHGETFATKKKGWYWHRIFSAPILEEGKPNIARLAEYLKDKPSDYNVRSTFLRCAQTAQIVTDITGKEFVSDRRIREYVFEAPWLFKRRIRHFVREMEASKHQTIVICTHSFVIELLLQEILDGKIHFWKRLAAPLPGVLTVIKNKKVEEMNFNEITVPAPAPTP